MGFGHTAEERSGERIRQLIVWPERVLPFYFARTSTDSLDTDGSNQRPFVSYTRTEDGASLFTEIRVLRALFLRDGDGLIEIQSGGELAWETDTECEDDGDEEVEVPLSASENSHKRSLSLPTTPRDWVGDYQAGSIPVLWSGAARKSPGEKPRHHETNKDDTSGRKRCLQLDLRGVADNSDEEGAYHLGQSTSRANHPLPGVH